MSDGGDGWGSAALWQMVVAAATAAAGFILGGWRQAASTGKSEGVSEARMEALAERVDRLEDRHDKSDDKIGMMAERIAQMPTRGEVSQGFDRLETLIRSRGG